MDWLQFTRLLVSGVAIGCVGALSGLGLVLTYKATGIFNFGHGAIATFAAYMYWQMAVGWHVPVALAALGAVFVIGPAIGLLLERLIFRPLQRRNAGTSEKLVASLGTFVLFVGICVAIWGFVGRDPPRLLKGSSVQVFSSKVLISRDNLLAIVLVLLVSAGLFALFRYTRLGLNIRAVVDRRELAELASIDANSVSAVAWMLGCTFAAFSGVIFAVFSHGLTPYAFTLLVIETFAVAVIARLGSLPLALLGGITLYLVRSELALKVLHLNRQPWDALKTNLGIIALFVFLLIYRNLDEVGTTESTGRGVVASKLGRASGGGGRAATLRTLLLAGLAALAPLALHGDNLKTAQVMVGTFVVFLSIVAITGFSGHITLGQAGLAGLGGWLSAKFSSGRLWGLHEFIRLPVIPAMLLAALVTAGVGVAIGYPALRRRGLFLGLTTLSVGLIIYQFIFNNSMAGEAHPVRPHLFGLSLHGDRAFLWFEVVVAAIALFLTRNLRSGRLGRILGAMRDSETATQSVGISLRKYKLFIFAMSAFIAALGGALLTQQTSTFEPESFNSLISLFWFTAVVVGGLSYLSGAAVAAFIYVIFDKIFGTGGALGIIGLGALLIGYYQGGLAAFIDRLASRGFVPRGLHRSYAAAKDRVLEPPLPIEEPFPPVVAAEPSDFARRALGEARR